MARRRLSAAAALVGAAALAACAGSPETAPVPCPQARILAGLESTTVFRGGASRGTEADLSHAVALQNIAGGCTYEDDGLVLNMTVDIVIDPGPALAGAQVTVPWFIAVAGPDGAIIDRQDFVATVPVEAGARSGSREAVEQRYASVGTELGPAYSLFLGLAIDPEEAMRRRALLP